MQHGTVNDLIRLHNHNDLCHAKYRHHLMHIHNYTHYYMCEYIKNKSICLKCYLVVTAIMWLGKVSLSCCHMHGSRVFSNPVTNYLCYIEQCIKINKCLWIDFHAVLRCCSFQVIQYSFLWTGQLVHSNHNNVAKQYSKSLGSLVHINEVTVLCIACSILPFFIYLYIMIDS